MIEALAKIWTSLPAQEVKASITDVLYSQLCAGGNGAEIRRQQEQTLRVAYSAANAAGMKAVGTFVRESYLKMLDSAQVYDLDVPDHYEDMTGENATPVEGEGLVVEQLSQCAHAIRSPENEEPPMPILIKLETGDEMRDASSRFQYLVPFVTI